MITTESLTQKVRTMETVKQPLIQIDEIMETENTEPQNNQKYETVIIERDYLFKLKGRLETVRETISEFSCSKNDRSLLSKMNSICKENEYCMSDKCPSQLSKFCNSYSSLMCLALKQTKSYNPEVETKEKYMSDKNTRNLSGIKYQDDMNLSPNIKRNNTVYDKGNDII